ncbi:MAG: zinc-binding dehydrogenase [Solirubrobacterales bacterium]|nr:zinc-binding dehydrogenase [Solirubrobacterales bacterium]
MKTTATVLSHMGSPGPFAESEPLVRTELELDRPGEGELLVAVQAAGLCHSDLSVITGQRPRAMPMALGHEASGEVVEAGSADSAFSPGDQVILTFMPACGECRFCRSGRPALCEPGAAANHEGTLLSGAIRLHDDDGKPVHHHLGVSAFSDHIVVSERSAVKVPGRLDPEIAALFGCAVLTGAGAVFNTAASALPAQSVAIFGLGGVGLAALLAARAQGAEQIIAVDRVGSKLELARELGATDTVNATAESSGGGATDVRIKEMTGGGVELALETVGNEHVLAQAYAATGRGGMTVTAGLPYPDRMLQIPAISLVAEERTLKGSYLGSSVPSRDIPRFIEMFRDGELPVDRLLSDTLAPDQINRGFDRLASGEAVRQVVSF